MLEIEDKRREKLNDVVYENYGDGPCSMCLEEFEESTQALLQVKEMQGRIAEMESFDFGDRYQVRFPAEVASLLRTEDMFLMVIAKRSDEKAWVPLHLGPLYESIDLDFTDEEMETVQ